jgi:lipid A 3-O-deacylase
MKILKKRGARPGVKRRRAVRSVCGMIEVAYVEGTGSIFRLLFFNSSSEWVGSFTAARQTGKGRDYEVVHLIAVFCALLSIMALIMPLCTWAGGSVPFYISNPRLHPANMASTDKTYIWQNGVGEGFRSGVQVIGVSAGATHGVLIFGGEEHHHFTLSSLSYGMMVGDIKGVGTWYRGNWELRGELFGGAQFNSETCWLAGMAPHLRYNFATGTRWVPYIDAGGGATLTEIRAPDLGGTFQFNLQASIGANYFFRDDMAISIEGRYLHLSSAHLTTPNNGVNTIGVFIGVNAFF